MAFIELGLLNRRSNDPKRENVTFVDYDLKELIKTLKRPQRGFKKT